MSDQTIDLIRRMPNLYYAAELAAHAHHDALPYEYPTKVLLRAGELYDALAQYLIGSNLTARQHARAADALKMLRAAPRKRARLDLAAKVFNSIPAAEAVLGDDTRRLLHANFNEAREHINAETSATRTLIDLLHDVAA